MYQSFIVGNLFSLAQPKSKDASTSSTSLYKNTKETKDFLGQQPVPFKHREIIQTHLASLSVEDTTKYHALSPKDRHDYLLANVFRLVLVPTI